MESLNNVELWTEDTNEPRQVIVNTVWGAFGDNGVIDFLRTKWDKEIDSNSLNSGKQMYDLLHFFLISLNNLIFVLFLFAPLPN